MRNTKQLFVAVAICVALILLIVIGVVAKGVGKARQLTEQLELGEMYLDELNYEQAVVAFQAAITIEPLSVEAYLGIAEVYMLQGEYEQAMEYSKKGYEITESEKLLDLLSKVEQKIVEKEFLTGGQAYLLQQDYEKALEAFFKVLEMSENPEAYLGIVAIYIQNEEYENALEYAKRGYESTGDVRLKEKITEIETLIEENSGGWSERVDYEDGSYAIRDYDRQGRLIRETEYYSDGTTWFVEISYNGNTEFYNYNDYASDLLEMDNAGRIIKQTFTYNDGRIVWNERAYDGQGGCIVYFYNSSGIMFWENSDTEANCKNAVYFSVLGWE